MQVKTDFSRREFTAATSQASSMCGQGGRKEETSGGNLASLDLSRQESSGGGQTATEPLIRKIDFGDRGAIDCIQVLGDGQAGRWSVVIPGEGLASLHVF